MTQRKPSSRGRTENVNANIAVTVLAVIASFSVVFTLFNATQFANLGGSTFVLVNILFIVLLVGMNAAIYTAYAGVISRSLSPAQSWRS